MLQDESGSQNTEVTLQAHVEELRSRCEAIACLQGGRTYYLEEYQLFFDYAVKKGLLFIDPLEELNRPPDDEGNEHQVWYLAGYSAFLKATWPDFFGLLVIHRSDEENRASPIDYLERWHLHNEIFGDDVTFEGVLRTDEGLRMVIRQSAIAGTPATDQQVDCFFVDSGWKRFHVDGEVAYFDPERNVAISDTHRGNLVMMDDGLLAPIDLRVQPLSGALLDSVRLACLGR